MLGRQNSDARPRAKPADPVVLGNVPVQPLYSSALVRLVAVFGIGVALAVAVATGAALWAGRQEAIMAARNVTGSLARPLTDAVARSINSIDVTLASVADLARKAGLDHGEIDLADAVAQRLVFTPHLRQILVVAVDGRVLFDSAKVATGTRLDVLRLVEKHRLLPRPLLFGLPVEGRYMGGGGKAAGQSLIPVSRAVTNADGSIAALVMAAINPEHFNGGFDAIETESGAQVHLWRYDGILLAGARSSSVRPGSDGTALPLFARHLKVAEMGTFIDADDDGVRRITSYRTTLSWPLVIGVGLPVDTALANWRRNAGQIGGAVALVILAVLGLTAVLVRTLAKRGRDEARLRLSDLVLANVSNGVTIADANAADLPLLYVNPAFERITGYSASQAIGRNARFLHVDDPGQDALNAIRKALAEGVPVTVKLHNVRADGILFWNQVSLTPVRDAAGTVTHWVGVQRDITQEEEARVALAAAYEDVARYSADLERFSFVLAHHLQEPARQMRLQAQVLLQRFGDSATPADREPSDLIVEASARLIGLLRDVQVYLAVERLPPEGAPGSAEQALAGALGRVSGAAPQMDKDNLPQVAMAQHHLDDLFKILVENAIQFRHPDRRLHLTVTVAPEGRFWLFRFADNGVGIHSGHFERIFIPLERLHRRPGHAGTGIGLAVARRIVEAARGRIWVESDGVEGSTFLFTLPMVE